MRHGTTFTYLSTSPLARPLLIAVMILLLQSSLTILPSRAFIPPSRISRTTKSNNPCTNNYFPLFLAKSGKRKKKPKDNTIAVNRQARRNYEIIETLEAGISLLGTEVKSIRDGKMNLRDGYVRPNRDGRGCTLMNVHIGKHSMSGAYFQHEERRERPLLVHKEEARKLKQKTEQTGMTIVPLKAYFNDDNRVKIQIGLCKGKNVRDKRQDIKERDAKREERRIIKNFRL